MGQVITFGEVLMRISPWGNKKFIQSNVAEFFFGGTELNVGISIARFGSTHSSNNKSTCISSKIFAWLRILLLSSVSFP